jgi:hypothetical protein
MKLIIYIWILHIISKVLIMMKRTISLLWRQKQPWLGVFWIIFGLYIIITKPNDLPQFAGKAFLFVGAISIVYHYIKSKNYI